MLNRPYLNALAAYLLSGVAFSLGSSRSSHAADRDRDLTSLEATRTRPLFSPTRHAPPVLSSAPTADAATPIAPPSPPPNLQLSGVVIGSDKQMAIVKRAQELKTISLEIGSEIDGWTVAAIRPREITLRRETQSVTIGLRDPEAATRRPAPRGDSRQPAPAL